MKLNFKEFGKGKPLLILHGLMGMLDNWQGIAKELSPDFNVFTIDLRNHGHSPHNSEFSYECMANDVLEFVDDMGFHEILLMGHSMGGKVAMKFAQNNSELVEKLIVVDIGPKAYPVYHTTILDGLNAIDFNIVKSRKEAENILKNYIPTVAERLFLLKNMYWKDNTQLNWRFNLEAITKNIPNLGVEINDRLFDKPTLFISGENSSYIIKSDLENILISFPFATFIVIPNASHWVHTDQPQLFLSIVQKFLFVTFIFLGCYYSSE